MTELRDKTSLLPYFLRIYKTSNIAQQPLQEETTAWFE